MKNESSKTKSIYNPTLEDVESDFDKYGTNPQHYILKAGAIAEFPDHIADLLKEKLATRMLWQNMPANKNKEKRLAELYKIIEVG